MTRRSAARRRSAAIVLQRPILRKVAYGAIGNGAERSQDQGQNR